MRTLNYILFFCLLLTSCKSNSSKINDFSVLIDQLEVNVDKITEDEWKNIEKEADEFEVFFNENREKLSSEERKKANKCLGKYKLLLIKKGVNDFKEDLIDVSEQIDGLLDEGDK